MWYHRCLQMITTEAVEAAAEHWRVTRLLGLEAAASVRRADEAPLTAPTLTEAMQTCAKVVSQASLPLLRVSRRAITITGHWRA